MKCNDQLLVEEIEKAPSEPDSKILLQHVAECPRCKRHVVLLVVAVPIA